MRTCIRRPRGWSSVSDRFIERLAEFLGHPEQDPHENPVLRADGTLALDRSLPLAVVAGGDRVRIYRVPRTAIRVLAPEHALSLTAAACPSSSYVRKVEGL